MLNLFLALLLSSFGASNLSAASTADDDTNKLGEAFSRIGRFRRWCTGKVMAAIAFVWSKFMRCCRRQIAARRGKQCDGKIRAEN